MGSHLYINKKSKTINIALENKKFIILFTICPTIIYQNQKSDIFARWDLYSNQLALQAFSLS
jgi:hypothetical protein